MKPLKKSIVTMEEPAEKPSSSDCSRQQSKKLRGSQKPGDRGACEKESSVQGSEFATPEE